MISDGWDHGAHMAERSSCPSLQYGSPPHQETIFLPEHTTLRPISFLPSGNLVLRCPACPQPFTCPWRIQICSSRRDADTTPATLSGAPHSAHSTLSIAGPTMSPHSCPHHTAGRGCVLPITQGFASISHRTGNRSETLSTVCDTPSSFLPWCLAMPLSLL